MSKLDKVDADLSAPEPTLEKIVKTVTRADVDAVLSADIPLEAKQSQLTGLIALLKETDRDDLLLRAEAGLAKLENQEDDPLIPQINF